MKILLHKLFSLIMAFLLMTSSISWTVGKHYCGSILVDISLFHEAEKCGMEAIVPLGLEKSDLLDASCCSDELTVVTGQEHLGASSHDRDLLLGQPLFLASLSQSYIRSLTPIGERSVTRSISPPLRLIKDIQLLDRVFLI